MCSDEARAGANQTQTSPIHQVCSLQCVTIRCPDAELNVQQICTAFEAQVLTKWHDARLEGYCVVWQAAADFAVKHLKEETLLTSTLLTMYNRNE